MSKEVNIYSEEFKQSSAKLAVESNQSIAQVTDYTSFTGSINRWSSSKTQKCAAAKLIWNWMNERKTTATRDDWQSLTQLLSEQKLTTAAQKGNLGLIYQKLQTMIS